VTRFLGDLAQRWKRARSQYRARALVRRQRDSADWPEVRAAFDRLREAGMSVQAADARLATALGQEIARMMTSRSSFDRNAYVQNLETIP
jgi:hypothetical protein